MPRASSPPARRYVVLFLIALLLVAADQLTKWWLRQFAIGEPLWRWWIFEIARVPPNTGAAFGRFPGHALVLVLGSLVGIAFILAYSFVVYRRYPLSLINI